MAPSTLTTDRYETDPARRADILWRTRAACRDQPHEMVPNKSDSRHQVQMAKKVCSTCTVVEQCLAFAEQVTDLHGIDQAQGVWAGLTERERGARVALDLPRQSCRKCGLDYVPINLQVTACSLCMPKASRHYLDYKPQIVGLIKAKCSYGEIALRLRLPKTVVAGLCNRWGMGSPARTGNFEPMPCGTLAAKYRHHRKEKHSWKKCPACRLVPWDRGKYRDTKVAPKS
jgi:hypothetical protein